MTMKPKYCNQCKVTLVPRMLDDRVRECCPACGKVFYRNPIPVASAVVLNRKRQVLLVRRARDPFKEMWCLPIGFAELEESIEEAALRELKEEAGIDGKVKHLLDVHSQRNAFYGDLLIVTFEVGNIVGTPAAGDDAKEVAWVDITSLPPLAFSANDTALAKCVALHRREWDQERSFGHMENCADDSLVSAKLLHTVERNAPNIVAHWRSHVLTNPATRSYRNINANNLQHRATEALQQLGMWLADDMPHSEVAAFFTKLGGERGEDGLDPHELVISLTFLRQTIWAFCRAEIDATNPENTYAALELNQRIVQFFDHATVESSKAIALSTRNLNTSN